MDFDPSKSSLSIAVNGALKLQRQFDYFVCGDCCAYRRDWFKLPNSRRRIIARLVASCDEILYPSTDYPELRRRSVPQTKWREVEGLPEPKWPHLLFTYKWFKPNRLSRSMNFLMFGATIAGCAVQLAYLMGATTILLWGCQFDHSAGHYFYKCSKPGMVARGQLETMELLLGEIRAAGIKVGLHKPSRLTQFDFEI